MRRRSVLVAGGAWFAAIAGCVGGRDPAADSTPSDSAGSSPSVSNPREAFQAAVDQHTDDVETMSLEGKHWTVAYSVEACCGDPFESHQATIAKNFSSVRPVNVSLVVTTFHECMNVNWRIPAHLARKHRAGEIDTETYVNRVQNTTSKENKC